MTYWIDLPPSATRFIDFIEFNNFLYFLFNYMIKTDAHKIKH
jgi:hypothetical protein